MYYKNNSIINGRKRIYNIVVCDDNLIYMMNIYKIINDFYEGNVEFQKLI